VRQREQGHGIPGAWKVGVRGFLGKPVPVSNVIVTTDNPQIADEVGPIDRIGHGSGA